MFHSTLAERLDTGMVQENKRPRGNCLLDSVVDGCWITYVGHLVLGAISYAYSLHGLSCLYDEGKNMKILL